MGHLFEARAQSFSPLNACAGGSLVHKCSSGLVKMNVEFRRETWSVNVLRITSTRQPSVMFFFLFLLTMSCQFPMKQNLNSQVDIPEYNVTVITVIFEGNK